MPGAATVEPPLTGTPGAVPSVAQPAVETTRIMRMRVFIEFPSAALADSGLANYAVTTLTQAE
jgi:hypothetical protein